MKILIHEWVTGGGLAGSTLPDSWAAEGGAMRRAIANDFRCLKDVHVVTTLDERFVGEEPPGTFVPIGPGEEEVVLARLTGECDYTVLIAPETGSILEDRARLIDRSGGTSLGSTPWAIALSADKLRLAGHFKERGVQTPRTEAFDARRLPACGFPYPAVVKPVDGAGTMHTYYRESADFGLTEDVQLRNMIVQPFCSGTPMSATFLVGPSGSVMLVGVGWQRIEMQEGRLRYRGGRLPAPDAFAKGQPFFAVRSVKGLRGLVGVDFVRDEGTGETTVIEINPRPTTSFVGWAHLLPPGSIARAWIDLFSGRGRGEGLRGKIKASAKSEVTFSPDGTEILGW